MGGFIAGLATIFLPLTQSLPTQLSTGAVEASVIAGATLTIVSILGRLAHHGWLAKLSNEAATLEKRLAALENVHP